MYKQYSDVNPPKKGNAKVIYNALHRQGYYVLDLHYIPYKCMLAQVYDSKGYGSWTCHICNVYIDKEYYCGCNKQGHVYVQGMTAPFLYTWLHTGEQ